MFIQPGSFIFSIYKTIIKLVRKFSREKALKRFHVEPPSDFYT